MLFEKRPIDERMRRTSRYVAAIGRAIRPQVPRADEGVRSYLDESHYSSLVDNATRNRADFEPIELEPPESTFPEKLVVFLDSA